MSRRYAAESAEIGERPAIKFGHVVTEAGEDDALRQLLRAQENGDGLDRDGGSARERKAIRACGDRGEGDRGDGIVTRQLQAGAIGRGQQRVFVPLAAIPYRADS